MNDLTIATANLAKARFLPFAVFTNKNFKLGDHLQRIAEKLEAVERGEIKRLIITMPPRHGKSQLVSRLFPAWYLGKNPDKQVIASSYGDELARDFARDVRNLIDSPEYAAVFNTKLAADSAAIGKFNTNANGVYIATGIGGALTGRGADIAIIDDPLKGRKEADSETIRKTVLDWYYSVLRTRLMPNGAIVIVGTRWHREDLIGTLLEDNKEGWDVLHFPAINDKGDALWPEQFDLEELHKTKNAITAREWMCLYQGTPSDPENQIFHGEFFRYWTELPTGKEMTITMTVDPAFTTRKESDYSCVMICGKYEDKTYVLEYINEKLLPNDLINEIIRLYKKWEPHFVGIESFAAQNVIGFYLQEKMMLDGVAFTWEEIRQTTNKDIKIKRLEPYFREGKIFIQRHHTELEKQLIEFPQGKHDDIIDALQMSFEFRLFDIPSQESNDEDYFASIGIRYNEFGEPVY